MPILRLGRHLSNGSIKPCADPLAIPRDDLPMFDDWPRLQPPATDSVTGLGVARERARSESSWLLAGFQLQRRRSIAFLVGN